MYTGKRGDVDSFDRQLLTYAVTWAPFGGPVDEDTFPEFGVSAAAFWIRVGEITAATASLVCALSDGDFRLVQKARAALHA